jgi:hypothetical protein
MNDWKRTYEEMLEEDISNVKAFRVPSEIEKPKPLTKPKDKEAIKALEKAMQRYEEKLGQIREYLKATARRCALIALEQRGRRCACNKCFCCYVRRRNEVLRNERVTLEQLKAH